MIDAALSNRPYDLQLARIILEKYQELTSVEKEILEDAVMQIYGIFDMEPSRYQFDFKFSRK